MGGGEAVKERRLKAEDFGLKWVDPFPEYQELGKASEVEDIAETIQVYQSSGLMEAIASCPKRKPQCIIKFWNSRKAREALEAAFQIVKDKEVKKK